MYSRAALPLFLLASTLSAQTFDDYINPILTRVPENKAAKELKQLTSEHIIDNDRVIPRASAAFLVVKTNQGRMSKLLVQSARQKIDAEKSIPILYVERYVTYREGE